MRRFEFSDFYVMSALKVKTNSKLLIIYTKGELISKAIYGLLTSPKKWTEKFVFFAFLLFMANKTNSSVHFLGESGFRFYLTFNNNLNFCHIHFLLANTLFTTAEATTTNYNSKNSNCSNNHFIGNNRFHFTRQNKLGKWVFQSRFDKDISESQK